MTFKINIEVNARDNASGPLGKIGGALGNMLSVTGGMLLRDAISSIGGAISNVGQQAFEAAGRFQVLTVGLETLLSRQLVKTGVVDNFSDALIAAQEPAESLLRWVKDIAVTTPFTVESIADVTRMSLAMGWNVTQTKELAGAIGDFTAGMGLTDEHMQRIIYNFVQMVAQGKVTGTELRDLARGAFVPIDDVLKRMQENLELTSMEFGDFKDAAGLGAYSIDEFIKAFMEMSMEEFIGSMDRMAMTWQTVESNVHDFIAAILGAELLGPFVDRLSERVATALENMMTPEVRSDIARIGTWLAITFERIMTVLEDDVIPAFGRFFETLGFGTPSIEGLGNIIGAVAGKFETWGVKFAEFLDVAGPFLKEHGPLMKEVLLGIVGAFIGFKVGTFVAKIVLVVSAIVALFGIATKVIAVLSALGILGPIVSAALGAIFSPVLLVVGAIIALGIAIGILVVAWTRNWGDIQGKTAKAIDNIKAFFIELGAKIKGFWNESKAKFEEGVAAWKGIFENVKLIFMALGEKIKGFFNNVKAFFVNGLSAWKGVWENFKAMLVGIWNRITEAVTGVLERLKQKFVDIFDAIKNAVQTAIDFVWHNILEPMLSWWISTFMPWIARIGAIFQEAFGLVGDVLELFKAVFMIAVTAVQGAWQNILWPVIVLIIEWFQKVATLITTILQGAFNTVRTIITNVATTISTFLVGALNALHGIFTAVASVISTVVTGVFNAIQGVFIAVSSVIQTVLIGAFNALKGIFIAVSEVIKTVLTSAFNTIKGVFVAVSSVVRTLLVGALNALKGIFIAVGSVVRTVVSNALTALKGVIRGVSGVLRGIWSFIKTKVIGIFDRFTEKIDSAKSALDRVAGFIRSVREEIQKLIDKVKNFKLPAILTPGSPTPFELGLRGIADALKEVDKVAGKPTGLFGGLGSPSYAGVGAGGGGGAVNYVTIQVSGAGDPDAVASAIMHKLRLQGVKLS